MGKLLKYEVRKTMLVKLIILGVTALLEIVYLIGLYGDQSDAMGIGASLLFMAAMTGTFVVGLASVVILHRDMNTRQSYMLFMTPNSCYKILGAKVLENGVSVFLTGAFFFALGALDISLAFAKEGSLNELWKMIQEFLTSMDERLRVDLPTLAALTVNILCGWISTVMAAYLGEVISAALLNGKRMNGIVSFLAILLLIIAISMLQNFVGKGFEEMIVMMLIRSLVALVCSVIMYFATARIMEQWLSV